MNKYNNFFLLIFNKPWKKIGKKSNASCQLNTVGKIADNLIAIRCRFLYKKKKKKDKVKTNELLQRNRKPCRKLITRWKVRPNLQILLSTLSIELKFNNNFSACHTWAAKLYKLSQSSQPVHSWLNCAGILWLDL